MSDISLTPDMTIEVLVRIITKGNDQPLTGSDYSLRLFDKDIFDDDYLGESGFDDKGVAHIRFTHSAFSDPGNWEERPDFYFVLLRSGVQFFQSKVMEDVDLEAVEQFISGKGEVIDLGTFLVDLP